jgi:2-methylisocitrate lyase-like PEP mutase family enzyme
MAKVSTAIAPTPLNVMAVPNLPSLDTLQKSGVRRLSAGSSIAQGALGRTGQLVSGFLAGTMSGLFDALADYGEMNRLFSMKAEPMGL